MSTQKVEVGILAVGALADATKELIRDFVYPVGSVYVSSNPTSPAQLFGGAVEVA